MSDYHISLSISHILTGLIIQEASYGPADTHDGKPYVFQDVTTQLQALVRNSQLHIPGGDSRVSIQSFHSFAFTHFAQAALQGFSDPAPFIAKSLLIRYLFRGRVHYAEVPDYLSVVLPLAGLVQLFFMSQNLF